MHDLDDDDNFSMRFQSLEEVVGQVHISSVYTNSIWCHACIGEGFACQLCMSALH